MEIRVCKTCASERPIEDFRNHFVKGKWYREYECIPCGTARARQWYWDNKEKALAKRKERYASDPEFRAKQCESARNWCSENRERCTDRTREWRQKNKEKVREITKRYSLKNPEKVRLLAKKGRAKRQNAKIGPICKSDIDGMKLRQKNRCAVCKVRMDKFHIDHIMPLCLGGAHTVSNLQLLCPSCNLSKSGKHPIDFMQSKGLLL